MKKSPHLRRLGAQNVGCGGECFFAMNLSCTNISVRYAVKKASLIFRAMCHFRFTATSVGGQTNGIQRTMGERMIRVKNFLISGKSFLTLCRVRMWKRIKMKIRRIPITRGFQRMYIYRLRQSDAAQRQKALSTDQ